RVSGGQARSNPGAAPDGPAAPSMGRAFGRRGPFLVWSTPRRPLLRRDLLAFPGLSMRLSRFFLPVMKETPAEAQIVSHRLMLRAGMVRQEAAGIYAWLPLGFRVLKKIEAIVRREMDRAGAIEMLMPTLQLADLWRESGRYDGYG